MKKKYYLIIAGFLLVFTGLVAIAQTQNGKFWKFADSPTVYKAYSSEEEFLADGGRWEDVQNICQVDSAPIIGSVSVSDEYTSTSTAENIVGFLTSANPLLLRTGPGAFGSVIITEIGSTGRTNFYDATTTNALLRVSTQATSSIIIASIPNNLAVGTYVFDVKFSRGLIVDHSGTIGTSTITYR